MFRGYLLSCVLLLTSVAYAGCPLLPVMRVCIDSPTNLFRCEITNTTDRTLCVERPFETGNTFVLRKNPAIDNERLIALGCDRRWGKNGPSDSYFAHVSAQEKYVFFFERNRWPKECVGWYDIIWKLENRFSKASWATASNMLIIGMGRAESVCRHTLKSGESVMLSAVFGWDSRDNGIVLTGCCSQTDGNFMGDDDSASEFLVVTLPMLKREIMIPVRELRTSRNVAGDKKRGGQKVFLWTDVANYFTNHTSLDIAGIGAVDLQWKCGDRKSSVLPLWLEREKKDGGELAE